MYRSVQPRRTSTAQPNMRVTLRCSTSRIRLRMCCKIARLYTVFDLDDEPAAVKSYGQSSNEGVRLQARTKKLARLGRQLQEIPQRL